MAIFGVDVGFSFRSFLFTLKLFGLLVHDASGYHYTMCYYHTETYPSALGAEQMFFHDRFYWGAHYSANSWYGNGLSGFKLEFFLYPLRYADGNHMNGWFRFKVKMLETRNLGKDFRSGVFRSFYLYAQNDWHEFVGEWLTDDQLQPVNDVRFKNCPRNDMTRYMGITCGGAYPSSGTVTNTVAYVLPNVTGHGVYESLNKVFIGPPTHWGNTSEMNFYFRISSDSCSTLKQQDSPPYVGLRFVMKAITDSTIPHVHVVVLNVTGMGVILGATDPLDLAQEVDCSGEIKEGDSILTKKQNFPWWANAFLLAFPALENPVIPDSGYRNGKVSGCRPVLFHPRCWFNLNHQLTPNSPALPKPPENYRCNPRLYDKYTGHTSNTSYMNYTEYLENGSKCPKNEKTCEINSVEIDAQADLEESRNVLKAKRRVLRLGAALRHSKFKFCPSNVNVCYDKLRGLHVHHWETLWNLRRGHGIPMVIVTIFLIPVSAFIARYFKETLMTRRIFNTRVWFQVHMHMSGWIFVLTTAGAAVAFVARNFLGNSLTSAAKAHQMFAYSSYLVFALVFLGSGLRHYDEGARIVTICCHWALGTLLYCINIGALFTSIWIPASPIAFLDYTLSIENRNVFHSHRSFPHLPIVLIVVWLVFDLLANVAITVAACQSDSNMKVIRSRMFCPTPIPVIRERQIASAPGGAVRIMLLVIYIVVSFVVTASLCYIIRFGSDIHGRGYGPMSCTHSTIDGVIEMRLPQMRRDCNFN